VKRPGAVINAEHEGTGLNDTTETRAPYRLAY
jgi:hypothetical protein